jgi:hypothetical protein
MAFRGSTHTAALSTESLTHRIAYGQGSVKETEASKGNCQAPDDDPGVSVPVRTSFATRVAREIVVTLGYNSATGGPRWNIRFVCA